MTTLRDKWSIVKAYNDSIKHGSRRAVELTATSLRAAYKSWAAGTEGDATLNNFTHAKKNENGVVSSPPAVPLARVEAAA